MAGKGYIEHQTQITSRREHFRQSLLGLLFLLVLGREGALDLLVSPASLLLQSISTDLVEKARFALPHI